MGIGGGALAGVGLVGEVTGFRTRTAGIGRDMADAGLTGDCVRGVGGLSLRIAGGARRGGRGAELEGTGRAGTGLGGVGTLRAGGVGARGPSDFGMDGGLPSVPSRQKVQN